MWWTGRHPGLSDEEDRHCVEEQKKEESLGIELISEIIDLLGDSHANPIPQISFERIPGDTSFSLVKPREVHVRHGLDGKQSVPYRGSGRTPYYRISNTDASIVKQTLEFNGFKELTNSSINMGLSPHDWVVQWSGPNYRDYVYSNLHEFQYVNHFCGSTELTRKDRIWAHFQSMQRLFGKLQFDFIPETFVIPDQLEAFIQVYERTDYLWIVKPHASSRGRGIFILQELSEIPLDCLTVICRYVESPYLIQGLKFDLRLYCLVTGFDPLRIYLFKEGLTRFASSVFSIEDEDLGNVYKHLTNYSINKYASNFVENTDSNQDNVGHKWSLSALNKHLACCNVDVKLCWSRIIDVLLKTILTVERAIVGKMKATVSWRSNCFELYGFDLLLDDNLKPHLLEVNLSPSMQAETPLDYKIKTSLVQETFTLLGPRLADQKQLGETRWKSRAKQLKRQGQRNNGLPYGAPLSAANQNAVNQNLLKPTVLNTPAARSREAERQQKFHNLQKKSLPLASLGEKPLRLLLECIQEFNMAVDFIRIFPTQASVKRYGHMIGIGSTSKSMSASQLLALALFNEPRLQRIRNQQNGTDDSGHSRRRRRGSSSQGGGGGGGGGNNNTNSSNQNNQQQLANNPITGAALTRNSNQGGGGQQVQNNNNINNQNTNNNNNYNSDMSDVERNAESDVGTITSSTTGNAPNSGMRRSTSDMTLGMTLPSLQNGSNKELNMDNNNNSNSLQSDSQAQSQTQSNNQNQNQMNNMQTMNNQGANNSISNNQLQNSNTPNQNPVTPLRRRAHRSASVGRFFNHTNPLSDDHDDQDIQHNHLYQDHHGGSGPVTNSSNTQSMSNQIPFLGEDEGNSAPTAPGRDELFFYSRGKLGKMSQNQQILDPIQNSSSMSGNQVQQHHSNSGPGPSQNNNMSTTNNTQNNTSSNNNPHTSLGTGFSYWNTSVVSTEVSKRGLDALERRVANLKNSDAQSNASGSTGIPPSSQSQISSQQTAMTQDMLLRQNGITKSKHHNLSSSQSQSGADTPISSNMNFDSMSNMSMSTNNQQSYGHGNSNHLQIGDTLSSMQHGGSSSSTAGPPGSDSASNNNGNTTGQSGGGTFSNLLNNGTLIRNQQSWVNYYRSYGNHQQGSEDDYGGGPGSGQLIDQPIMMTFGQEGEDGPSGQQQQSSDQHLSASGQKQFSRQNSLSNHTSPTRLPPGPGFNQIPAAVVISPPKHSIAAKPYPGSYISEEAANVKMVSKKGPNSNSNNQNGIGSGDQIHGMSNSSGTNMGINSSSQGTGGIESMGQGGSGNNNSNLNHDSGMESDHHHHHDITGGGANNTSSNMSNLHNLNDRERPKTANTTTTGGGSGGGGGGGTSGGSKRNSVWPGLDIEL